MTRSLTSRLARKPPVKSSNDGRQRGKSLLNSGQQLSTPNKDSPQGAPETKRSKYARLLTEGAVSAARVIAATEQYSGLEDLDVAALVRPLRDQATAAVGGNLAHGEAMLMNQAVALQSLFTRLAERGMKYDTLPAIDAHLRLALRAQSQCRATLETLAAMKNPGAIAFVTQANIGQAVQVNNGTPRPSRTGESEIPPNKLLEANHGERLDTGAASTSGQADPELATVGAIQRPEKRRRKGKG